MEIRKLQRNDYDEILTKWWADWKWTAPNREFLPDDGEGGLIVYDGEEPICAGFIYVTNSKVCWVDWIVSNRNYTKKPERKEALNLLIESLTELCKKSGAKFVYALLKNQSLVSVYEEIGYSKADNYNLEMIKSF
jgi:hypothetical protein